MASGELRAVAALLQHLEPTAVSAARTIVTLDDFAGAVCFDRPDRVGRALDAMTREFLRFDGVATGEASGRGWVVRRFACRDDLASARPIRSPDGHRVVVWFGDFYDAAMRAGGDVGAALLEGVRCHGADWISKQNGVFAGAMIDARERTVVLFGDRYATRALFYRIDADGVLFSTRLLPLCRTCEGGVQLNQRALARRMRAQFLRGDDTLVSGIEQLPPATVLTIRDGRPTSTTYWSPQYRTAFRPDDLDRCADGFVDSLTRAIQRAVSASSAPFGSLLSGGLDSRIIVGLAAPICRDLYTLAYGIDGSDDRVYGAAVASAVGAAHDGLTIDPDALLDRLDRGLFLTDGMLDLRHFHGLAAYGRMKPRVRAIFDGQAGDHFTGYLLTKTLEWMRERSPAALVRALYEIDATSSEALGDEVLAAVLPTELREHYRAIPSEYPQFVNACRQERFGDWVDAFHLRQRQRRYIANTVNNIRAELPVLTPFLDYEFVDFCLTVPEEMRWKRRLYIHTFTRHLPALSRIPWSATGRPIGADPLPASRWKELRARCVATIRRRSGYRLFANDPQRFADYDAWMSRHAGWRATVIDSLTGAESRLAPLFDAGFRHDVLNRLVRRGAGGGTVSNLVSIERWLRLALG